MSDRVGSKQLRESVGEWEEREGRKRGRGRGREEKNQIEEMRQRES